MIPTAIRRISNYGVVLGVLAVSTVAPSKAESAPYPVTPPQYPAFLTAMCPPEPSGPLENAPNAVEGGRTVALTFDDGPGPSVPAIITVLEKYHIRATFLNDDTQWPSYLRTEFNDGYLMGNHTGNHTLLTGLTLGQQLTEIDRSMMKTYSATKTVTCAFRPPYGGYDANTIRAAAMRRVGMWMWNVGTGDFLAQGSDSPYWIRHIWTSALGPGLGLTHPTVLLHDQHHPMPATVDALPIIIQGFLSHGYTFVDLLGRSGEPDSCPGATPALYGTDGTSLQADQTLSSGASLVSPNGEFTLTMRTDGNLAVSLTGGRTLWTSGTAGHSGAVAVMDGHGVLRVTYGSEVFWSSGPASAATRAVLGNNGNLVTVDGTHATWSSNSALTELHSGDRLLPGWSVYSPSGRCAFTQALNGSLRLRSANGMTIWSNGVRAPGASTTLANSGSLISVMAGTAVWNSLMTRVGDWLRVTNTGHVEFRTAGGVLFFVTP